MSIMSSDLKIPKEVIKEVLIRVMEIQKEYAHELSGVKTERRDRINEAVNKIVAERLEKK